MPRPATSFTALAGVPLHYDRLPGTYGTRGRAQTWFMQQDFADKLQACLDELWETCPLGEAEVVATAGAWVDKPGAHGEGRGFDIDAIFWSNRTFVTLHYPTDSAFYLAVEAVLRKHFGTVLNFHFNQAHQDHFHIDDLAPVGFVRHHRSRVLFVQMAMNKLFGRTVDIDGRWGSETGGAVAGVLESLDLTEVSNPDDAGAVADALADVWLDFLDACAARGFGTVAGPGEPSASDLLRHVYELIDRELAESTGRKRVETALTAFAEHPDVAEVLE